jgi:ATP-dependent Clp protease ATP-binding subunit ClpC
MAADLSFPVGLVHRKIGPGAILSEALFVPEITRLNSNRDTAVQGLTVSVSGYLLQLDPEELIRRRRATTAREHTYQLTLEPPRTNDAWRNAVVLRFHAAVWEEVGYILARVPALAMEVIASPRDDLDSVLKRETLNTLRRMNLSVDLKTLATVQTTTAFRVEWQEVRVKLPSLKERATKTEEDENGKKTILHQVATRLRPSQMRPAYEVEAVVRQLFDALTAKPPQSVLLVGPSGVGKSAIVRELVRLAERFAFEKASFYQTSGSRIVAGQSGFGMWEKRCQELVKEASKRHAILHIGSLAELMDVGKSEFNSSGIAAFLRPAIARGELLCIAECTPEQLPIIEKENPQLPDAFRQIVVEEPDREQGLKILTAFAAHRARRVPTPSALQTLDRLHRRYATYSAYPGRPLRFLNNLLRDGEPGTPIAEVNVYAEFTRETGLPREMIDPDEALELNATRGWFAERVVGQPEAVEIVVDLLATIKAGLTRENRPIASLLFLGPTGVGKTELAKAIAEYLFGSRDRLTRFDMSEFADPVSVRRLVGTGFGTEGLLTAKIREQPFCVLLLDEVEKAHTSAFDLLLQALGEARLTDAGGRLADFRNTVVILTSNLGAESFRSGSPGFSGRAATVTDAKTHFTKAVEKFLRPEMFNRLDRIRKIADREWQKVLNREGVRFRDVRVQTGEGLLDHLAAIGFDPRYGARPLKRAMERELLAPLAKQMNRHGGEIPLAVEVGMASGTPTAHVRPLQGTAIADAQNSPGATVAASCQTHRRWHQLLAASTIVRDLENDITRLQARELRLTGREKQGKKMGQELRDVFAELGRLREIQTEIHRQREQVVNLENAAVMAYHTDQPVGSLPDQFKTTEVEWDQLLIRLYSLNAVKSQFICLHLFAESRLTLADMVNGYRAIARQHGLAVSCIRYRLPGQQPSGSSSANLPPQSHAGHKAPSYWHDNKLYLKRDHPHKVILWRESVPADVQPLQKDDVIGFGLLISGPSAHLRFSAEAGWHQFDKPTTADADTTDAMVYTSSASLTDFVPDEKLTRKGGLGAEVYRRRYERDLGYAYDRDWIKIQADNHLQLRDGTFEQLLAAALELTVRLRLMQMIVE